MVGGRTVKIINGLVLNILFKIHYCIHFLYNISFNLQYTGVLLLQEKLYD